LPEADEYCIGKSIDTAAHFSSGRCADKMTATLEP
jgi:hypothetical protein